MAGFYSNIPKQICRASPNPNPISNPYSNPDPNPSSPHYSNLERVIVSSSVAKSGEVGSRSSQEFSSWLRWMMMIVGVARRMKVGVGVADFPEPGTFRASSMIAMGTKASGSWKMHVTRLAHMFYGLLNSSEVHQDGPFPITILWQRMRFAFLSQAKAFEIRF